MAPWNTSSMRCHSMIIELCGAFLDSQELEAASIPLPMPSQAFDPSQQSEEQDTSGTWMDDEPVEESPQTQINGMFSMMWPNADIAMGDDAGWMEFLQAGGEQSWANATHQ